MPMFKWGDSRGFGNNWEDAAGLLKFKEGEVYSLRAFTGFLPVGYHWVPFKKATSKRMKMFPHICLAYDVHNSRWEEGVECPFCSWELDAQEHGVHLAIDVDSLYAGEEDGSKVIVPVKWTPRELGKLRNLVKLNKDKDFSDAKSGRIFEVIYDPNASDKANKFQFSLGERLPIKILGEDILVRIPEHADSDYAGEKRRFPIPDLESLIVIPSIESVLSKCKSMHVKEGIKILKKERAERDEEDKDGGPRRRRAKSADDDDEPRRRRRSRDDDDDELDNDEELEELEEELAEEEEEQRPRRTKKPRRTRRPEDDDDLPRPRRKKATKKARRRTRRPAENE